MNICMDPRVHFGSTWRDPIGKVLTNRKIREHMLNGWYGPQHKAKAQAKVPTRTGFVFRCGCGATEGIRFLRYSYLPSPGWYCATCFGKLRRERQQEQELKQRYKDAAMREYE